MKEAKQNQTQSCVELKRCIQVVNDSNNNNYIESDNYELNNR